MPITQSAALLTGRTCSPRLEKNLFFQKKVQVSAHLCDLASFFTRGFFFPFSSFSTLDFIMLIFSVNFSRMVSHPSVRPRVFLYSPLLLSPPWLPIYIHIIFTYRITCFLFSIYIYTYTFFFFHLHLSMYLSMYLSMCLCIYVSIYVSIYLSIYLSI